MWLLNVNTEKLENVTEVMSLHFTYAILSHTWGDDEVSFADMMHNPKAARSKKGYAKIKYTCQQAIEDELKYCWIDTICIDRASSSELSEAINSMYRYYRLSRVCYAYLNDVPADCPCLDDTYFSKVDIANEIGWHFHFAASRWHTRSWTLQELIAPEVVRFYGKGWNYLGSKGRYTFLGGQHAKRQRLRPLLTYVTNIDLMVLENSEEMVSVSAARKMMWASKRSATRVEDQAYSLLGIFRIHMPLLYGEGQNAFLRLQQEIFKSYNDLSLLAWSPKVDPSDRLLANTPLNFREAGDIIRTTTLISRETIDVTYTGMRVIAPILRKLMDDGTVVTWMVLNCRYTDDLTGPIAIRIMFRDSELNKQSYITLRHNEYYEASISLYNYRRLEVVDLEECKRIAAMQCLMLTHDLQGDAKQDTCINSLPTFWFKLPKTGFTIAKTDPTMDWNRDTGVLCPKLRDAVESFVTIKTESQATVRCIIRFSTSKDFWSRQRAVHSLEWGFQFRVEVYEEVRHTKPSSLFSLPPEQDRTPSGELRLTNGEIMVITLERKEIMGTLVFVIHISHGLDEAIPQTKVNGDSLAPPEVTTINKTLQLATISG